MGSTPVVGHSVELDAKQLRRAGLVISVPLFDTFELARLLLPGLPRYDLQSVARALGVYRGEQPHRALEDARLAARVFNQLVERVRGLDLDTLAHISRLSDPNWPLRSLFIQAQSGRIGELLAAEASPALSGQTDPAWLTEASEPRLSRQSVAPSEQATALDSERLVHCISAGGEVATRMTDFEERPEQIQMLRAVAGAINSSENLLVEAGTGIGKSLAYLLPAVHFAVANNSRVVVSTNTINLQDQLAHKDLPAVRDATSLPLKFTVLKGRSNYLCLRRWTALLESDDLTAEERSLLIKTLLWLPQTSTGDRAELRLEGREAEAWTKVCALADACSPRRCAYNRIGRCFLARARRAAEASHLIIVNHSLLLADLATQSRVLPEYRHLIVDEAHHLEDEATAQLGWRLGLRELTANLARLWEAGPTRSGGLIRRLPDLPTRSAVAVDSAMVDRLCAELAGIIDDLTSDLPLFFELIRQFVAEHGQRSDSGANSIRLTAATRAQPAWSDVEVAWDDKDQRLRRLLRALGELLQTLQSAENGPGEWDDTLGELVTQATFWQTAQERLWTALVKPDPATVAWLSSGRNDEVYVNTAPLHPGGLLREGLFADNDCVVLTSATMTTEGSFDYLRERLGVDNARDLMLGSPFDYGRAVLLYLPADLAEPNTSGYQRSVERVTGELITALEGRTLVLLTSHSQLRATYEALKEPLDAREILLLGQGMDGVSRARHLDTFKAGNRVALMGTSSFWEGVDVVGEALSCLVITRLPFTTPSDPLFQARSELFEDPFREYAVPQAILRFRQGFGRLIRSHTDRGVVVVLDRRLTSRFYGRAFLGSLPGCELREGPSSQAATAARDWLDRPRA